VQDGTAARFVQDGTVSPSKRLEAFAPSMRWRHSLPFLSRHESANTCVIPACHDYRTRASDVHRTVYELGIATGRLSATRLPYDATS
jgi:hypothetical protein